MVGAKKTNFLDFKCNPYPGDPILLIPEINSFLMMKALDFNVTAVIFKQNIEKKLGLSCAKLSTRLAS